MGNTCSHAPIPICFNPQVASEKIARVVTPKATHCQPTKWSICCRLGVATLVTSRRGTLGSTAEQNVLGSVFGLDFFRLPRFKPELFYLADTSKVLSTRNQWCDALFQSVKRLAVDPPEHGSRRAVLLICDSVRDVLAVTKVLRPIVPNIVSYHSNRDTLSTKVLRPGDVIVATNLAGRGTDLETNEALEQNGGLHVTLTYMPTNVRVQEQAFGRTARKGKKGTGDFILVDELQRPLHELQQERDQKESKRLDAVVATELARIRVEEDLLHGFQGCGGFASMLDKLAKMKLKEPKLQRQSLMNRWAFWLDSVSLRVKEAAKSGNCTALLSCYQAFEQGVNTDLEKGTLILEPAECVLLGEVLRNKEKWTDAKKQYEKASTDPGSAISQFYAAACGLNLAYKDGISAKRTFKQNIRKVLPAIDAEVNSLVQASTSVSRIAEQQRLAGMGLGENMFEAQMKERMSCWNCFREIVLQSVGSEVSVEELQHSSGLADLEEAQQLLQHLIDKDLIKARRCSLKVKPQEGGIAQVWSATGWETLRFSASLEGLEPAVSKILQDKVQERKDARRKNPQRPSARAGELTVKKLSEEVTRRGIELPTQGAVWDLLLELGVVKEGETLKVEALSVKDAGDEWWEADALKVENATSAQQIALCQAARSLVASEKCTQSIPVDEMLQLLLTTAQECLEAALVAESSGESRAAAPIPKIPKDVVEKFRDKLRDQGHLLQSDAFHVRGWKLLEHSAHQPDRKEPVHLPEDPKDTVLSLNLCSSLVPRRSSKRSFNR